MVLRLVSSQYEFEAGEVSFVEEITGPMLTMHEGHVQQSVVCGMVIPRARAGVLIFRNLLIKSRSTGVRRSIPWFVISVPTNISGGVTHVDIPVPIHAVVRVQVTSMPLRAAAVQLKIGVALEMCTVEVRCDEAGGVDMLLPLGEYEAYLVGNSSVRTHIVVQAGLEDGGSYSLQ